MRATQPPADAGPRATLEEGQPVFTRQQALATGLSIDEIRWAITSGRWTVLRRGHYALTARVDALKDDASALHRMHAEAALTHLRCDAVVSHRSAALLHGLPLGRPAMAVTVTAARQQRRTAVGVDVRTTREHTVDHVMVDGLPLTPVARTVVDIARSYELAEALVVADAALHRNLVTRELLNHELDAMHRWPGASAARRALRYVDQHCADPQLSWCRGLLIDQELPVPDVDVAVSTSKHPLGRYAFVWPQHRTLAALDPASGTYEDQLDALRRRRRIDDDVRAHGYEIVSFSIDELTHNPADVAHRIRWAFSRREDVA